MTRSKLHQWWPELAFAAFMSVFLLVRSPDGPLFVAFEVLVVAVGWVMGHRHRRLPMQATLDGVRQDVTEVREIILDAVAQPGEQTSAPSPDWADKATVIRNTAS